MGHAYNISLGSMLTVIYNIDKKRYHNQVSFFADFFGGYHRGKGDEECMEWVTCQSMVSEIMRTLHDMPDGQYQYYTEDDDRLYIDVERYICRAAKTNRQRTFYHDQLLALVINSANLDPQDKQYILGYKDVPADMHLKELMYRMLYILIREPNNLCRL